MMTLNPLEIWIVAFFTLALFSFLYKDNPVYKIAEHIFAGLSAGYYVGLIWDTVIIQQLWDPILQDARYSLIIPGILGFLMFTRFSKKLSWVSRVSLAFVMGTTAGIFLVSQLHGLVLPQMQATMTPATEAVSHDFEMYGANLYKFEIVDSSIPPDTVAGHNSCRRGPGRATDHSESKKGPVPASDARVYHAQFEFDRSICGRFDGIYGHVYRY